TLFRSEKLVRRKVSLKHLERKDPEPGPRGSTRLTVTIKEGIEPEKARQMVKIIKDSKLKVQPAIQEDTLRVSGKKRDDLQAAIQVLRSAEGLDGELQFINFRDSAGRDPPPPCRRNASRSGRTASAAARTSLR